MGVIIAIPAVILLSPLYLIISILILIEDGGPVFYKPLRGGFRNNTFRIFKFRTMVKDADKIGGGTTALYDPRITKIGNYLRKTKLDEIPQLFNVINGTMSFIGPRPKLWDPDLSLNEMPSDYYNSFMVKPGITGYAQAYYRNSITQDEKFHWDAYYADNCGFLLDIKIVFRTIYTVIASKNINTEQSYKK